MDLIQSIESAENQFIQILEDFFISVYNEKQLPSHGLDHHKRVWKTAKELIIILAEKARINNPQFISSLLLASYLHDLGMAIDAGPRHGKHSRELCKRFLYKYGLIESDFPGLLEAVQDHDNKDYSSPGQINLHTLLSVADDLDAFGFTGIYRYIEIYVLRGSKPEELASKIRENARKRYDHFEELFRSEKELISKHSERYELLEDFFRKYEFELKKGRNNNGYVKVVKMLSEMANNKEDLNGLINELEKSEDQVISWFFGSLKAELRLTIL